MKINERLKQLRNARGLSTRALAEKVGSYHTNIIKIENGALQPRLDTLSKICDALGAEIIIKEKQDDHTDNDI